MKRLQFLLALPTAALGMNTKPSLSRAARDKAKEFGVPLVLGGQKLQKVYAHNNHPETLGVFYFEDFKVEVGRYSDPRGLWVPVSIYRLGSPVAGFLSMLSTRDKDPQKLIEKAFAEFQKMNSSYKEI